MNTTAAHSTATRTWNALIFCASISAGTFTCGASAEAVMAAPVPFLGIILEGGGAQATGGENRLVASSSSRPDLSRGHGNARRAAHAGAAEPAIAHRVLGEILLMIILGEIERRRVDNLGGGRSVG